MRNETYAPDPAVILHQLKELDYLVVRNKISTYHSRQTVGWNAAVLSSLRKAETLEQLESFINENNIPVFIEDQTPYSASFKIMIKL